MVAAVTIQEMKLLEMVAHLKMLGMPRYLHVQIVMEMHVPLLSLLNVLLLVLVE